MNTFDWMDFSEGRARFVGSIRGWDELGHEAFAVELSSGFYYGEIDSIFLENRNNYNVEITSFGWPGKEWVGMPIPGMCKTFTNDDLETARSLIFQLIRAAPRLDKSPSVLRQTEKSHFQGEIIFRDGWAFISNPGVEQEAS